LDKKKFRVVVDAMGGDFAPMNEIQGVISTFESKPPDLDLEIILIGNENKIRNSLEQFDREKLNILNYSIIHTDEVITMDDEPTIALKKKKNSSLYKGLELHSQGYADAFVSAGNTGAVLSTATILNGRINGVSRPTIGSFFPTKNRYPTLVLDVGANIDTKPRYLYEFAVMGSIYTTQMLGLEHPKVGLLNIGEEESKGNDILLEAYQLLKSSNLNFLGNVEGRDILNGTADVVVCDGFTGNVILKFAESVLDLFKTKLKSYAKKNIFNTIMFGLMKPAFKKVFAEFDYQKYGGVPILGINGVVIIGHGKSSPLAIQNMIYKAIEQIKKDINKKIEHALTKSILSTNN
jgi:glycerol-3-phosphate acyltransferase PlsX